MNTVRCVFPKLSFPPLLPLLPSWRCSSTYPISFSSQSSSSVTFTHITESDVGFLLNSCGREGNLLLGLCFHAWIVKTLPVFGQRKSRDGHLQLTYNCLLNVYCKCGEISDAVKLFDDMPLKDTVSWNSLISGFLKRGDFQQGYGHFKLLFKSCVYRFDHASLTSLLSACGGDGSLGTVKMIHALAILNGYEKYITVGNALTTTYIKCQSFESGMRVFNEMVERNVVTWTAVISGLAQNKVFGESLKLFEEMYHSMVSPNCLTYLSALSACSGLQALKEGAQIHSIVWKSGIESDLCIQSALMDMYSKCGCVEDVWRIFESMEDFDEVSITVILSSLAQNGFEKEAIHMFVNMMNTGTNIDPDMISAVLGVFDIDISQGLGVQIHSFVIKKGFTSNVFISNSLINMYSKCGQLQASVKVFDWMPERNQVSWNSIIAAFARHGDGFKAIEFYEKMRRKGVQPTDVTFLSLVHACSHVGLLQKGMEFLESMEKDYGMCPRMEHYASIVDMLGRAGRLKEAKGYIEALPVKPDALIWQALLGACGIYGDINTGKYAAEQLAEAAPNSAVPFISLANIYSRRGRWKERAATIKKMKEKGISKEAGVSWIEIEKTIHSFVVADQIHPEIDDIYDLLLMVFGHMRDEDYVLEKSFISF